MVVDTRPRTVVKVVAAHRAAVVAAVADMEVVRTDTSLRSAVALRSADG
jgi:hypothetical protein